MLRWPRWSAEPFGRRAWLLLCPAGAVVGIVAEWRLYGWAHPGGWVPDLLTGWCMIGCGLAGWARRPQSRSGAVLAAAGFAWFVPDFAAAGVGTLDWLAVHALYLHRGPLVQLVLTYPRGRARGRLEGGAVVAGYVAAVAASVWESPAGTVALAACLVAVAVRGYVRAAGRERRMRRSALQATALFAAGAVAVVLVRSAVPGPTTEAATLLAYEVMLCALAAGLLIGLVRWPWERAEVADLVVELGEARSGTLRDELARALGDPSLQVGYWLAESVAFVDAAGRPLAVPAPGSGRAATMVERDGQPLAVLVHDAAVLGDPGLAEAVAAAAGLAAANARLQAEVRSRLAEIAASRRRILTAADEERGRLERLLRDGAQRRLGELAQALRLARQPATGQATAGRIARAELQLARTQEDLGRLARGLHPRQLSGQGLGAALAALAGDFPLRVDLAVPVTATSPAVAACVYFVCSEALANVAKHASASAAQISVTRQAGAVTVEVADDGAGSADPRGRGIRGLADRVETLGGTLTVTSAPGRGTRLTAVIPDGATGRDGRDGAGRGCLLQRLDLADERAGLRVGLQAAVDGGERPAQGGQVRWGGGGETGAQRARLLDVGAVLARHQAGRVSHSLLGGPLEPGALLGGQGGEPGRVGEQHIEQRPQRHVRGDVPRTGHRHVMHVPRHVELEPLDRPCGQVVGAVWAEGHHRGGAQRADRLLLDAGAVGADGQALPVRGGQQRPAHRDGMAQPIAQDRQAGHVHPAEPGQHPAGQAGLEHGVFQRVTVDQHRRRQRPQAWHSDGVEHLAAGPAQVHRPGGDGVHHLGFVARCVVAPLVDDRDLDRPARQDTDPADEIRHWRGRV